MPNKLSAVFNIGHLAGFTHQDVFCWRTVALMLLDVLTFTWLQFRFGFYDLMLVEVQ